KTTTLGREGSDYSAAIIAYCIDAKEITIFKDVSGVLSADPREFENTVLLHQISYKEAVELAFFGASVIHPKTLQPLQNKKIPLRVKSFVNPLEKGTLVANGVDIEPKIPCFILKKDQILISISDKDFHFIMEDDISEIFDYLHQYSLKVNLIQNSAISFTVCVEDNFNNFGDLVQDLNARYKVLYNKNLTLYTIRHFTDETIKKIEKGKKVFIKQLSRETVQIVVQN
ncbi:MAG: aspartate kinase, partial [Bacteroidetes bacterium]